MTMTCSSEGLPAPEIFWSKKLDNGNLKLLSGNATLTLVAMRTEDSGSYVCEGVNLVGRNKAEVELTVQGEQKGKRCHRWELSNSHTMLTFFPCLCWTTHLVDMCFGVLIYLASSHFWGTLFSQNLHTGSSVALVISLLSQFPTWSPSALWILASSCYFTRSSHSI